MADRLAFMAEWLDPQSDIVWSYQLFYYPSSGEVEMFDVKNKRHFLKRVKTDQVRESQLFVGATITLFSRQLKLTSYGDERTRTVLGSRLQKTLAMIKPDAVQHLGKILTAVHQAGFTISNLRMCALSRAEAQEFYSVHAGKPFFERLVDFMSSGRIVAMELVAEDAIAKWRRLIGPTDSNAARASAPDSLRAAFGTDNTRNACHGSDAPETAAAEAEFFFGKGRKTVGKCVVGHDSTLVVVKPHAVKEGLAGLLLDTLADSFALTAAVQAQLEPPAAAEFLEVYKGVVPPGEFSGLVAEMTSGPCIAVEVQCRGGGDAVEAVRAVVGPLDPEVGRVLRPTSLRAQFGSSRVLNAVHCTDLPGDGPLEVGYFFDLLVK